MANWLSRLNPFASPVTPADDGTPLLREHVARLEARLRTLTAESVEYERPPFIPRSEYDDWPGDRRAYPSGFPQDRKFGQNYPLIRNEQDLREARATSRLLAETNPLCIGFLAHIKNFVVGTGFKWDVGLRGVKGDRDKADPDVLAGQQVLDEFRQLNGWGDDHTATAGDDTDTDDAPKTNTQAEAWNSAMRDGEYFARLFQGDARTNGVPRLRRVNPECVYCPPGETPEGPWSFGIQTDPDDRQTRLAYHVADPDRYPQNGEKVPAGKIVHLMLNADSDVKRGVPDLWPLEHEAVHLRKLWRNMSEVSAILSAIAYIRQHAPTTTGDQIRSMVAQGKSGTDQRSAKWGDTFAGPDQLRTFTRHEAGTIIDVTNQLQYTPGPINAGAPGFLQGMQATLRIFGLRWGCPEYFSGDASNANFASTLVAGGPFERATQERQGVFRQFQGQLAIRVLLLAAKAGRLTRAQVARLEVRVTPPGVAIANKSEDTQRRATLFDKAGLSQKTWLAEEGYDAEQEAANKAAEQPPQQQPGVGGGPRANGTENGGNPPQPDGGQGGGNAQQGGGLADLLEGVRRLNEAVTRLTGQTVREDRGPPPWPGAVFDTTSHRWKVPHQNGEVIPTAPPAKAKVATLSRMPQTKDEADTLATVIRDDIVGEEGAVAETGQCLDAARCARHLSPEIEVWRGVYPGEYEEGGEHQIFKAGKYFIDVTADQFGGPDLAVFTQEDIDSGRAGEYGGFVRYKAAEKVYDDWPVPRKGIIDALRDYDDGVALVSPPVREDRAGLVAKKVTDKSGHTVTRLVNPNKDTPAAGGTPAGADDHTPIAFDEPAEAAKVAKLPGLSDGDRTGLLGAVKGIYAAGRKAATLAKAVAAAVLDEAKLWGTRLQMVGAGYDVALNDLDEMSNPLQATMVHGVDHVAAATGIPSASWIGLNLVPKIATFALLKAKSLLSGTRSEGIVWEADEAGRDEVIRQFRAAMVAAIKKGLGMPEAVKEGYTEADYRSLSESDRSHLVFDQAKKRWVNPNKDEPGTTEPKAAFKLTPRYKTTSRQLAAKAVEMGRASPARANELADQLVTGLKKRFVSNMNDLAAHHGPGAETHPDFRAAQKKDALSDQLAAVRKAYLGAVKSGDPKKLDAAIGALLDRTGAHISAADYGLRQAGKVGDVAAGGLAQKVKDAGSVAKAVAALGQEDDLPPEVMTALTARVKADGLDSAGVLELAASVPSGSPARTAVLAALPGDGKPVPFDPARVSVVVTPDMLDGLDDDQRADMEAVLPSLDRAKTVMGGGVQVFHGDAETLSFLDRLIGEEIPTADSDVGYESMYAASPQSEKIAVTAVPDHAKTDLGEVSPNWDASQVVRYKRIDRDHYVEYDPDTRAGSPHRLVKARNVPPLIGVQASVLESTSAVAVPLWFAALGMGD